MVENNIFFFKNVLIILYRKLINIKVSKKNVKRELKSSSSRVKMVKGKDK